MVSLIRTLNAIIVAFCLTAAPVFGAAESGIVTRVSDGDSLRVEMGNENERIRLHGIDAPEIGQEFGSEARDFVRDLTAGRTLNVERLGSDRYGRDVAIVRLPDGRSLNAELVRQGYAWWSRRHAPDNLELADAERGARVHKRGLWRQSEPIPPWFWRAEINKSEKRNHGRFKHSLEHIR